MFYVYEISIKATGEVIYVGKGTRNRYKTKKKNKLLNRLMKDNECEIKITHRFEDESDAFEMERQRILELKKIGQAICNNASYSTGGKSSIWTYERRKKQSENNPMKKPEQRKRMSENNPMKNKEVANRVAFLKSHTVVVSGNVYKSIKECAKAYNVSDATVSNWIKKGFTSNGEEIHSFPNKTNTGTNIENPIPHEDTILYDGKEYMCVREMSLAIGVKTETINYWLRKGYSSIGLPCRRKFDTQHKDIPKNVFSSKRIPVIIDGVHYDSVSSAVRETGLSRRQIKKIAEHI